MDFGVVFVVVLNMFYFNNEWIISTRSNIGGDIMRGDVWVAINKNGEKVLHIDNGKFVSKKVIDKPQVRYNIVQPKNN